MPSGTRWRRRGSTAVQSFAPYRHLQTPGERQCHGPKLLGWIIDECEIVGIGDPVLLGVVAYDDGPASQMRGDEFERRSRHRNPDIDQREIYRPVDLSKCLPQIALSEIDETGQTRFLEMRPCRSCLLGLVLRADYYALTAGSTKVVAQGGSQINRRDAV